MVLAALRRTVAGAKPSSTKWQLGATGAFAPEFSHRQPFN